MARAAGTLLSLLAALAASCTTEFDRSLIGRGCADCPIASLSASFTSTCVVRREGRMWCWGSSLFGQLGVPGLPDPTVTPTEVLGGAWARVGIGSDYQVHGCAVDRSSALRCWGANGNGEAGVGDERGEVVPPERIGDETDWSDPAAGTGVTCGLRDAVLHCWGWAADGRLGLDPGGSYARGPTRVPLAARFRSLSVGADHGCAIDVDGGLWCWGSNDGGKRGRDGAAIPPAPVRPADRFERVAAGHVHTCAIRVGGALECWGANGAGQLGGAPDADGVARVAPGTRWREVAAGESHTCAIDVGGALHCWGEAWLLGIDEDEGVRGPTRVGDRSDWTHVAAGRTHTCGATRDGSVWCWGSGAWTGSAGSPRVPTLVLFP